MENGRKNWGLEALVGTAGTKIHSTVVSSTSTTVVVEVEETTVEIRGELLKPVEG